MKRKKWSVWFGGLSVCLVLAGSTGEARAAALSIPSATEGHSLTVADPLYRPSAFAPAGIQVETLDSKVPQAALDHIRQLVQQDGMVERIQHELGISLHAPVRLFVASDVNAYRETLRRLQFPEEQVAAIAEKSNGVTSDNEIVIVLARNPDDGLLANVLQHELTHVALNQYGVSAKMPSWINEGIAWHLGLQAQALGRSALFVENQRRELRYSVLDALAKKEWVPLIDDPMDTLAENAAYNVEVQDYFAVESLIRYYGESTLPTYLALLKSGDSYPFLRAFGVTRDAFEKRFTDDMLQSLSRPDKGVRIRFRIEPDFTGFLALMGKGQSTWIRYHLPPGEYTAVFGPDGRIDGLPPGEPVPSQDAPDEHALFIGMKPSQAQGAGGKTVQNGGFAIESAYGDYFLLNAWITYADGSTEYPLTDRNQGVTLLSIEPLS
jgi:hypothetical protein